MKRREPDSPARTASRFAPRAEWIVFAVALAVRLVHVGQLGHAPWSALRIGDAESYHLWASRLAAGDWLGGEVFYQAPLYPYLLGVVYAVLGQAPWIVRVVQSVLGATACVLLTDAGTRWFSRRGGLIAGLLLALYAPAIFYDGLIQKSSLDLVLVCGLLAVAARTDEAPDRRLRWGALGLVTALLVLTRENALALLPVLAAWAAARGGAGPRRRAARVAWLLAGLAVVLTPVAVRNRVVGGELHLTTSQFGPNFYIGNRAGASGIYEPLRPHRGVARYERQDAIDLAEQALGRPLGPGEVSAYWRDRTLHDIRLAPARWARLMLRKLALTWNATEIVDTEDLETHARWSVVLAATAPWSHFGLLAPLAAIGVALTASRRRRLWPLYAMPAVYTVAVALFFVFGRYRYPLVPFLVLFAAAGLDALPAALRQRRVVALAAGGLAAALLAVGCNLTLVHAAPMRATTHMNFAAAFREAGRLDLAATQYELALEERPGDVEAVRALGAVRFEQGRTDEAVRRFERAAALDPGDADTWFNLGTTRKRQGDQAGAVEALRRATELAPGNSAAWNALGTTLFRLGRRGAAAEALRRAVDTAPDSSEAHNNLANVYLAAGDAARAQPLYERAVELDPTNAQAWYGLGLLLENRGDARAAADRYRRALELDPGFDLARRHLAALGVPGP